MGVLNKVHHVGPALQTYNLEIKQIEIVEKLQFAVVKTICFVYDDNDPLIIKGRRAF